MTPSRRPPLQGHDYLVSILQHYDRHTALNWAWAENDEVLESDEELFAIAASTQALPREAAVDLIGKLFDDIRDLSRNPLTVNTDDLQVVPLFPPCSDAADRYEFACRLMATLMTVAWKLTVRWSTPASVAEEIALHMVLDQAEVLVDLFEVPLDAEDWRPRLTDALFEDLDFEHYLQGGIPRTVDVWAPFRPRTNEVHPYAVSFR